MKSVVIVLLAILACSASANFLNYEIVIDGNTTLAASKVKFSECSKAEKVFYVNHAKCVVTPKEVSKPLDASMDIPGVMQKKVALTRLKIEVLYRKTPFHKQEEDYGNVEVEGNTPYKYTVKANIPAIAPSGDYWVDFKLMGIVDGKDKETELSCTRTEFKL